MPILSLMEGAGELGPKLFLVRSFRRYTILRKKITQITLAILASGYNHRRADLFSSSWWNWLFSFRAKPLLSQKNWSWRSSWPSSANDLYHRCGKKKVFSRNFLCAATWWSEKNTHFAQAKSSKTRGFTVRQRLWCRVAASMAQKKWNF